MASVREVAAAATMLMLSLMVTGCADVAERYGPRTVQAPVPLGDPANEPGALPTGPLRPSGPVAVTPSQPSRQLLRPEVVARGERAQPAPPSALIPSEFGEPVSINFVDTDIREVVDTVLGGILGRNYTIDPRVQGRITTRTVRPVPYHDVRGVLLNILAANGATIVDDGQIATVVPLSVAQEMPRVVVTGGSGPQERGFGTYFIPVRHVSADSIRETIAGQVSPGSQLAVDPTSNLLIFAGPEQDARAVEEMVRVLDIDVLADRSFALVPLRAAQPREVAVEVNAIVGGGGDAPGRGGRVLPVERLNAVLAVADSSSDLRELANWITRLDRADLGQTANIFVYYLRSGTASDMAETLSAVFGAAPGASTARRPDIVAPGLSAAEIGVTRAVSDPVADVARGLPGYPGVPGSATLPGPAVETDEFGPDYLPGGVDEPAFPGASARFAPQGGTLRIVADDVRNAIIVHGSPDELRAVQAALARLDIQPIQILIEATIAEVTLNDELEYGIRWAFETGDFSGIFTNAASTTLGPVLPGLSLILDTSEAIAVLRLLSEITNVEVVSSPQLMVLENQPARLVVGDQVPVATQSVVSIDDLDAPIVNAINYVDTGVILEVTPRVNADGLVTMQVVQEVSDAVRTQTSELNSPTIQQRLLNSTVAVRSGQTVVLGGLIRERQEDGRAGIPLLMDIPVLGNLFRITSRSGTRTELLVLITPRVVRDGFEAMLVTNELRNRLTELRDVLVVRP
jgi:general secretion pathway protein D